jgi:hypothetical protein
MRGREPKLRAVLDLVRGAANRRGGVLLIEGDLGAGKSLLLSQAASAAEAADTSVAAAADELSRFMPLGPVLMALGESPSELANEAGASGQVSTPIWLVEAARTRLKKRAAVGRFWSAWTTCTGPSPPPCMPSVPCRGSSHRIGWPGSWPGTPRTRAMMPVCSSTCWRAKVRAVSACSRSATAR